VGKNNCIGISSVLTQEFTGRMPPMKKI